MLVGIIADTHDHLPLIRRAVAGLRARGAQVLLHAGDFVAPFALNAVLSGGLPMIGVFGNNDQERDSLVAAIERNGFTFQEPPFELVWHQRRIIVVHDPLEFQGHLNGSHDLALHGHTHMYRHEYHGGSLIFNPGECAGHMLGYNAIGVLDLADLSTEILKF